MLVEMNETSPPAIALEMNQCCAASDGWSLLRRLKSFASPQTPKRPRLDRPIEISPWPCYFLCNAAIKGKKQVVQVLRVMDPLDIVPSVLVVWPCCRAFASVWKQTDDKQFAVKLDWESTGKGSYNFFRACSQLGISIAHPCFAIKKKEKWKEKWKRTSLRTPEKSWYPFLWSRLRTKPTKVKH